MTRQKLSMKELWESFRGSVVPRDAPQIQVVEMRRAFYAGAKGLMDAVIQALDPDRDPTAADMAYMGRIQAELEAFTEGVLAGRN